MMASFNSTRWTHGASRVETVKRPIRNCCTRSESTPAHYADSFDVVTRCDSDARNKPQPLFGRLSVNQFHRL